MSFYLKKLQCYTTQWKNYNATLNQWFYNKQTSTNTAINIIFYWYYDSPLFLVTGANMIVSGSAIMKSNDPAKVITELRSVVQEAIQQSTLER